MKQLFDHQLDKNIQLHEGFNKICGLKQGIVRALIEDPKMLILDEATSALDGSSQEIVKQVLDRAMEGRASIVIVHRLSTIRNCGLLFVINSGQEILDVADELVVQVGPCLVSIPGASRYSP